MTAFQPAFKLHPLALHLVNPVEGYRWLGGLIVDNFAGGGGAYVGHGRKMLSLQGDLIATTAA